MNESYKLPVHLRGGLDEDKKKQIKEDLRKLDEPLVDGIYNLCYGDGYFANSLKAKYGMSLSELRKIVNA